MRFVVCSLLLVLLAPAASARQAYTDYIPAAPVNGACATCHTDAMGDDELNAFGLDAESTISQDGPDWSRLFCRDSDGDGATNGQELGDPCGTWTPGAAPLRTEPISAPGDPDDVVDVDDAAACSGGAPPLCESAVAAAGCGQAGAGGGPLALLVLGLVLLRRARHA